MAIDLKRLKKQELRNLLDNARRLGREDVALDVLRELTRQGGGKLTDYDLLTWNQVTARAALAPFVEVSRTIPDNQRTSYTEAGGRKIGRSRDDPEWMWVDSYTAIKTGKLNIVFVCYIPRPGDDAHFILFADGQEVKRYEPDELEAGLEHWRILSAAAV